MSSTTARGMSITRGDAHADGQTHLSDALTTFDYLFRGSAILSSLDPVDADGSGIIDIADAIYLLGYLFLGGSAPPPPGTLERRAGLLEEGSSCEARTLCI